MDAEIDPFFFIQVFGEDLRNCTLAESKLHECYILRC